VLRASECEVSLGLANLKSEFNVCSVSLLFHIIVLQLRLLLPVVVVPHRVLQELFQQRCPPQCTSERQVSFWRLLHIIGKFGSTKPTFLPFNLAIRCTPSNLSAKRFKVALALSPFFLGETHDYVRVGLASRARYLNGSSYVPSEQNIRTFPWRICSRDVQLWQDQCLECSSHR